MMWKHNDRESQWELISDHDLRLFFITDEYLYQFKDDELMQQYLKNRYDLPDEVWHHENARVAQMEEHSVEAREA